MNLKKLLNTLSVGVVAALCVGLFFGLQSFQETVAQREADVRKLEADAQESIEDTGDVDMNEDDVVNFVDDVNKAGKLVAKMKNQYAKELADTTVTQEQYLKTLKALEDVLPSQFSVPWYYTKDGTGSWKFVESYEFVNRDVKAFWQYTDDDGRVYAYVTALYDVTNKQFTNVKTYITSYGAKFGIFEGSEYGDSIPFFSAEQYGEDMKNMMDTMGIEDYQGVTEEQEQDMADASELRNQMRQEYEKEQREKQKGDD